MVHYPIEYRFHGKAKYEIKKLVYEINRRFGLRTERSIPHITVAGPFYTNKKRKVLVAPYAGFSKSLLFASCLPSLACELRNSVSFDFSISRASLARTAAALIIS